MPTRPILRTSVQYSTAFCSQLESAGHVISGRFMKPTVPVTCVEFHDRRLNFLEKFDAKPMEAAFSNSDNCRRSASDVISSVAVDYVTVDVRKTVCQPDLFYALLYSI